MSKKVLNDVKSNKRQHPSLDKDILQETIKKPRKVVNKNKSISNLQKSPQKPKPLNPYQSIEEVPKHKLTVQQMNGDPVELLNKLEDKYSQYGAVKLVVCDEWNAPFTFRYIDKEITTRIQRLQQLKEGRPFEQKVRAYRIQAYESMARRFSNQYKFRTNPQGRTQQSKCEQQYWNLVTKEQYNRKPVQVEYAADLSTSAYGSGFPLKKIYNWMDTDFEYETNFFNLNNISKSPSSLLNICQKRKQKISGITYPWLYMGMQFSTFCWHVEDLYVNSVNYNHKGATKTWYVVPRSDKQKFDNYVEKKFQGKSKKKNVLEKIILMIDPLQLIQNGIKVYKANQRARQYVCTFFKAYHGGFSHGFNVGEAINFISAKSLKYIQEAQKDYVSLQKQKDFKPKPLVISKQWLIYENILQNTIKNLSISSQLQLKVFYDKMIKNQFIFLNEQLIKQKKLQSLDSKHGVIILPNSLKYEKVSCHHCKNYIYLSAIECKKCGILCENHIDICKCGPVKNMYTIHIRQPNKDRMKVFKQYPILSKSLQAFEKQHSKDDLDSRSLSLDHQKQHKSRNINHSKSLSKPPIVRKIKA